MKKIIIALSIALAFYASHFASAACINISPTFPASLDTFATNDCIPAVWANALESSILGTSTSVSYLNVNATGSYLANGTPLFPYKAFSAALASTSNSGGNAYIFAPGTYIDGAPDTLPGTFTYMNCQGSTLVEPSGITFPGSFDSYDCTIAGNVSEADTSTLSIHQWNNSTLTGNVTLAGLGLMETDVLPVSTSTLTTQKGSLLNVAGTLDEEPIINSGILNLNDDEVDVTATTTTGWGVYSSSTGGAVEVVGMTGLFPNSSTQGIYVNNGATSTPNVLVAFDSIVATTTPGATVNAGSAATELCDGGPFVDSLNGQFVAPSGTDWQPCYDEDISVLNDLVVGTGTVPLASNLTWIASPSSTVRVGVTSTWPGCIEMYDNAASGTLDYIYSNSGALVDTSTKPAFCK